MTNNSLYNLFELNLVSVSRNHYFNLISEQNRCKHNEYYTKNMYKLMCKSCTDYRRMGIMKVITQAIGRTTN